MQKNIPSQWAKWLVLPLLLTACGGSSEHNMATEHDAPKPKEVVNSPATTEKVNSEETSTVNSNAQSNSTSTAKSDTVDKTTVKIETPTKSEQKPESKPKETVTKTEKPKSSEIAKTPITTALEEKVLKAKEALDSPELPDDYEADYVITTSQGTETAKLRAPEKSSNDPEGSNNYRFNAGSLFPAGESIGTMKSYLNEDGTKRKPHTEETFMSYQQFYSGISGSQKQAVYFGDERVERNEPFYFDLPEGLLTTKEQLPTTGEATYQGKAIDGNRFGQFTYQVDFAAKEGKGGSIVWDQNSTGKIGDITLKAGKIDDQVLSVASEPDLWPDEYSHRAPGVTGAAEVAGNAAKYQYTAVFFGPMAEELGGLVYEAEKEHDHSHSNGGLLGGEDTEKTNVTSFTGERR